MPGPGAGTGRVGVWKAGVWVESLAAEGAFASSATAVLGFDGGSEISGAFRMESEAITGFVALAIQWGIFRPVGEALATFAGAFNAPGAFQLDGEAETTFASGITGRWGLFETEAASHLSFSALGERSGSFDLDGEALGEWQGFPIGVGELTVEGTAENYFVGVFTAHGAFASEAQAELLFLTAGFSFFEIDGEAFAGFTGQFIPELATGTFAMEAIADLMFSDLAPLEPPSSGPGEALPTNRPSVVGCLGSPSVAGCQAGVHVVGCLSFAAQVIVSNDPSEVS